MSRLALLNKALTIGLEEGRPEIQSKACHLIYGIAIRPSYGVRSITPWMRKLIEKAEHSEDADGFGILRPDRTHHQV